MFCILTPVLAIPIMLSLGYGMRPRKADPTAPVVVPPPRAAGKSFGAKFMSVFWQLDFVGLLLFVAGAGMILVTITIANGKGSKWSDRESPSPSSTPKAVPDAYSQLFQLTVSRFSSSEVFAPSPSFCGRSTPLVTPSSPSPSSPTAPSSFASSSPWSTLLLEESSVDTSTPSWSLPATNRPSRPLASVPLLPSPALSARPSLESSCATLATSSLSSSLDSASRFLLSVRCFSRCHSLGADVRLHLSGLMIRYRGSTNSQGDLAMVQVVRGIGSGFIGFP